MDLDFSEVLISSGKFPPKKEDKKDAALCLLPKELEGTDIGVAAAAQAFK